MKKNVKLKKIENNFKDYKNHFIITRVKVSYSKVYYFKFYKNYLTNERLKKKILVRYSYRVFHFFKIIDFLKKNLFNVKLYLRIIFNYQNFLWYICLLTKNQDYYYFLIKFSLKKYYRMLLTDKKYLITNQNSFSSYLSFFNKKNSTIIKYKEVDLNKFHKFFLKNLNNYSLLEKKVYQNIYIKNFKKFKKKNFNDSLFLINFLRVQRRYNKRRYSKVRTVSRPSFFAGISLSSIFVGMFWGGTIKSVDWNSVKIINIDINLFIFIVFFLFYF